MQATKSPHIGKCERIVITAANGRTYDLGSPDALLFRLRVFLYRIRRMIHG